MKIAIVGSRSFNNYELLEKEAKKILLDDNNSEVISGGAKGADSLAKRFAIENNLKIIEFLPDWEKHGKSAGPIRNKQIVESSDFVLAFWDGESRGTKNSIDNAKRLNKQLKVVMI